tara:strand:+ start:272 stop:919 length:648 start_codon:yes stop_codon:yes gene_type:complete
MSFQRTRSFARPAFLAMGALSVALLASCTNLPHIAGDGVTVVESGNLAEMDPNDIVVAPLILGEGVKVSDRMLREAFVNALIERHYAPLSLDYVDANMPEPVQAGPGGVGTQNASYVRGILNEDAVLQVIVNDWDESLWNARKAIRAQIEVRLENSSGGPAFWVATFDDRRDFAAREKHHATMISLRKEAFREIAKEILSQLPRREAAPGAAVRN